MSIEFYCAEPAGSPENTSYAWDISHALVTTYHPYSHSPSALTEYLKHKLRSQRAKRLGRSLPAQVEPNVQLERNNFDTVESYCQYFNWLKSPSKLELNSNYHQFKSGIKLMWEDEANVNGSKCVLTMKNNLTLLDQCWQWLTMALVGEEFDESDEICGTIGSL